MSGERKRAKAQRRARRQAKRGTRRARERQRVVTAALELARANGCVCSPGTRVEWPHIGVLHESWCPRLRNGESSDGSPPVDVLLIPDLLADDDEHQAA